MGGIAARNLQHKPRPKRSRLARGTTRQATSRRHGRAWPGTQVEGSRIVGNTHGAANPIDLPIWNRWQSKSHLTPCVPGSRAAARLSGVPWLAENPGHFANRARRRAPRRRTAGGSHFASRPNPSDPGSRAERRGSPLISVVATLGRECKWTGGGSSANARPRC